MYTLLTTIDGELSASVRDVLSMAVVSSGKLSAPVSGVLLTAAVSDALSSVRWCRSVVAVSLRWSLVGGQRAQLRLTSVLHGGGEHWHRRVDHSPIRKIFAETLKKNFNLVDFLR